jgi:hypothetical protein
MTPQLDSGTSFQASLRSPSGSDTTSLLSSASPSIKGYVGCNVRRRGRSVLKNSERDRPSLE